jgi:Flp pilus assembly protein TadD
MQRVLEDDPLCQISYHALGVALDGLGLEAEAESAWTRSVELDPQFAIGWMHLAMHQSAYGKHAEACESAERAYALFPTSPYVIGTLAGTLEATGESARALALLTGEPPVASRTAVSQVCYHLTSGNFDEAIRWIARAAETNFAPIASFLVRPYERFLSKSHAWPALLAELGLEPAVRD